MPRKKQKSEPPANGLETPTQRRRFIFEKITTAMSELNKKEVIHWHLESPEITEQMGVMSEAMAKFVEGKGSLEEVKTEYKRYVDLHRRSPQSLFAKETAGKLKEVINQSR